jgi:multidrug efflux pump subunit AcrA (membrane-fusion protein)
MVIGACTAMSDYEIRLPDFRGRPELPTEIDEYWEITEWKVRVGESVQQGQPFVRIETDDLEFNVGAPVTGVIRSLVDVGQKIKAGDLLAVFDIDLTGSE